MYPEKLYITQREKDVLLYTNIISFSSKIVGYYDFWNKYIIINVEIDIICIEKKLKKT